MKKKNTKSHGHMDSYEDAYPLVRMVLHGAHSAVENRKNCHQT